MGAFDCSGKTGMANLIGTFCFSFAWCFNVAAFSVCRFVKNDDGFFESPLPGGGGGENFKITAVGLYTMDINGYCYVINWTEATSNFNYWLDGSLNSARACGGFAAFVGFVFMVWMWCALCCSCGNVKCIRKVFGFSGLLCSVLSGLMFLIYQSFLCDGTYCGFSQGGGFTVAAIVLYFFASVAFCAAPDPDDERYVPQASSGGSSAAAGGTTTVTVEKTELGDGTVVEKKTTTHPDGSQTVEETTTAPAPEGPMDEEEPMQKAQVN